MQKTALVEALLFSQGSYRIGELAKVLDIPMDEVRKVVEQLKIQLEGGAPETGPRESLGPVSGNRGIVVITNGDEVMLGTHPDASAMLENIRKEELTGPLTKQALETLAIIAYGDNAPKHLIDGIRGVNSQFTLRNLIERGLIERFNDPNDKRAFRYRITTDALRYMGITAVSELPGFLETNKMLQGQGASGGLVAETSDESTSEVL